MKRRIARCSHNGALLVVADIKFSFGQDPDRGKRRDGRSKASWLAGSPSGGTPT